MSINSNSVVNTTFFDSGVTAPQIVSPTSTSLVANNANALDVAATDDQWMIKQMMAKPLLLATISWTTSQTAGTPINYFDVPKEILLSNPNAPARRLWNSFTFFRGNYHFKFLINATKFHVGRLMAAWTPLTSRLEELNQYTLSGYPHVFIDAANSDAAELMIPFFMPTTSISTLTSGTESKPSGQLVILVLN